MGGRQAAPTEIDRIRGLIERDEPVRWLFTGDSITHGALHTNGARDYVQLFEERLRWELGRRRDHVLRTGVSGRTVGDLEADFDWSVLQYRPHVVSMMFGLNDANVTDPDPEKFGRAVTRLIDSAHAHDALVIVHTPNWVSSTETGMRLANLQGYAEATRAAAVGTGAVLVDHMAEWQIAEREDTIEWWINDGCHPNAEGHRVLYRSLARTLGLWDSASPTGRLFIPGG